MDPDPLLFLYDYSKKKDIEIAGLIAACFAYGKVFSIMKILRNIFKTMKISPYNYLVSNSEKTIVRDFKGFKYRFTKDFHLSNLLLAIKKIINDFSSLKKCFYKGWSSKDDTILQSLTFFYKQITQKGKIGHLMGDPEKKSACKKSNLFLRWMVRKDDIDLGLWNKISPAKLIVPLDTHMHKIGLMLKFTKRKSADIKTAMEITKGFKQISKQDPVKYDFSLTRFGIRQNLSMDKLRQSFL
ncbi:MAG: TIGR02757 family protein [Desulfobacteraceae bacterium 4572_130]|nr:MAG: TIGR02757 family protein [Desulfobacteraceae bacterium 4572_130]